MCSYNTVPLDGIACNVDVRSFGPCIVENLYGYHKNSPCVFLTLKEMYAWQPEFYNDTEMLPEKMPVRLKRHIEKVGEKNQKMVGVDFDSNYIFMKFL